MATWSLLIIKAGRIFSAANGARDAPLCIFLGGAALLAHTENAAFVLVYVRKMPKTGDREVRNVATHAARPWIGTAPVQ